MNIHSEHERSRLILALDRQGRSSTGEEWLSDQATIDNALSRLQQAGHNPESELESATTLVASWAKE